jgi:hypothetical protein
MENPQLQTVSSITMPLPRRLVVEEATPVLKPEAQLDPSSMGVDLPSKFHFYPQKTISVKPLKGFHQAKFSRAAKEKSNRHMADAISSLLPSGFSAYDLTIPDYYWILYYLRITCYTKNTLIHTSVCTNPEHILDVAKGIEDRESLVTVTTLTRTHLKDIEFDEKAAFEGFDFNSPEMEELKTFGVTVGPSRVGDMVELDTLTTGSDEDSEMEFKADFAGFLAGIDRKMTLAERLKVVDELSNDALSMLSDYRTRVSNYGVEETIRVRCGKCGAESETTVSISAHSFL